MVRHTSTSFLRVAAFSVVALFVTIGTFAYADEMHWSNHQYDRDYGFDYNRNYNDSYNSNYNSNYNYNGNYYTNPYNSYDYSHAPYCTITISNYGNVSGYPQSAQLSWHAENATSAYLSPEYGSVPLSDTRTVYPHSGMVYTLTVYGPSGVTTCQTTASSYYTPYDYSYNTYPYSYAYATPYVTTPYITLSQMPYTGFDYGPIGNALYFAALLVFALAVGYVSTYYVGVRMPGAMRRQHLAFAQIAQKVLNKVV